ncbi:MAG: hypothetical protein ACXWK5_01580, partial [Myxococcaceae bacterium]
ALAAAVAQTQATLAFDAIGGGLAWGVGGWLVTTVLERLGAEETARMRARAVAELTTTFASHYAKEVSLAEMLRPEEIAVYGRPATGSKYLVKPNRWLG